MLPESGGNACGTLGAMQRRAVLINRLAAYAQQRGRAEERLTKLREFCSLVENRIMPHKAFAELRGEPEFESLMEDLLNAKQQLLVAGREAHYAQKAVRTRGANLITATKEQDPHTGMGLTGGPAQPLDHPGRNYVGDNDGVRDASSVDSSGRPLQVPQTHGRAGIITAVIDGILTSDSDNDDESASHHFSAAQRQPINPNSRAWQKRRSRWSMKASSSRSIHRALLQQAIQDRKRAAQHREHCRTERARPASSIATTETCKDSDGLLPSSTPPHTAMPGLAQVTIMPEDALTPSDSPFPRSSPNTLHLNLHDQNPQELSASGGLSVGVRWRRCCGSSEALPGECDSQTDGIEISVQPLPSPFGTCRNQEGAELSPYQQQPSPCRFTQPLPRSCRKVPDSKPESQTPTLLSDNTLQDKDCSGCGQQSASFAGGAVVPDENPLQHDDWESDTGPEGSTSPLVVFLSDIANGIGTQGARGAERISCRCTVLTVHPGSCANAGIGAIQEVKSLVAGLHLRVEKLQEAQEEAAKSTPYRLHEDQTRPMATKRCATHVPVSEEAGPSAPSSPPSPMGDVTSRFANQSNAFSEAALATAEPVLGALYDQHVDQLERGKEDLALASVNSAFTQSPAGSIEGKSQGSTGPKAGSRFQAQALRRSRWDYRGGQSARKLQS